MSKSHINGLIKCNEEGDYSSCGVIENVDSGYYANSGFESSTKGIISCSWNNGCSTLAVETSCSGKIGKVISSGSTLNLCISSTNTVEIIKDGEAQPTKSFKLTNIGDFPGSIRKAISININGDGSVTLDDNTAGQLPICNNSCTTGEYCINRSNIGKIQTGNGSCNTITGTTVSKSSGKHILYFDANNKLTEEKLAKKAYECTFESGSNYPLGSCTVIDEKYHFTKNDGILLCSSINECILDDKDSYYLTTTNDCLSDENICDMINTTNVYGYLYKCTNSGGNVSCVLINKIGYYIENDNLYSCITSTNVKCKMTTKSPLYNNSSCSNNNIGKVVYNNNEYKICTGNKSTTKLTESGVEYVISYGYSDELFELSSNKYGIIKASSAKVVFSSVNGNN